MRNVYLACYDISDPKRLRQVHKKMRGFGDPLQFSVFVCCLSREEKLIMLDRIKDVMDLKEDRFVLANIGPADGKGLEALEFLGISKPLEKRNCVII